MVSNNYVWFLFRVECMFSNCLISILPVVVHSYGSHSFKALPLAGSTVENVSMITWLLWLDFGSILGSGYAGNIWHLCFVWLYLYSALWHTSHWRTMNTPTLFGDKWLVGFYHCHPSCAFQVSWFSRSWPQKEHFKSAGRSWPHLSLQGMKVKKWRARKWKKHRTRNYSLSIAASSHNILFLYIEHNKG